jgi:hypothetical protein
VSKLDERLSKFVGVNEHDLSKVVVGDILVRDVYNNGGFNGCFNAVTIDKKLRTILMSDGSSVDFDGKNKSGFGCYRLPKDDEIEKETNVALWRRLSFFDYEFLPKDMLIRLNNILDNYLDRRNQRRVEMKSRAENTNSTEIRTTKNNVQERRTFDDKPKRSWSTIAKTLEDKEEQTWKKKNKIKKSKHKR